jgi:hypothetical protein
MQGELQIKREEQRAQALERRAQAAMQAAHPQPAQVQ